MVHIIMYSFKSTPIMNMPHFWQLVIRSQHHCIAVKVMAHGKLAKIIIVLVMSILATHLDNGEYTMDLQSCLA